MLATTLLVQCHLKTAIKQIKLCKREQISKCSSWDPKQIVVPKVRNDLRYFYTTMKTYIEFYFFVIFSYVSVWVFFVCLFCHFMTSVLQQKAKSLVISYKFFFFK